ncbi:hypothetical protein CRI69_10130 [Escherichia sp. E4742]|nr:hypothetical protein CRI69_10130 [Escherichia sp. E4742]
MGARGYGYNLNNKILSIKLIYLYNKRALLIFTPEITKLISNIYLRNACYFFNYQIDFTSFGILTQITATLICNNNDVLAFIIECVNVPKMKFRKKTFITHFLCILMGYIF